MQMHFRRGPLLLHAAIGATAIGYLGTQPACGEGEELCLRNFFLGWTASAWVITFGLHAGVAGRPRLAWLVSLAWLPVAWLLGVLYVRTGGL